jgi:hypothetical protein
LGLPLRTGSYGQTKFNRSLFNISKTHVDAACVVRLSGVADWTMPILENVSRGRRSFSGQRSRLTAFPRGYKAVVPTGKYAGTHVGRVAVRSSGSFDIQTRDGKMTLNH